METGPRPPLRRVAAAAFRALERVSGARVGLALAYHTVGPEHGDPAHQLVPPMGREVFVAQMEFLRTHYRPVRASEFTAAVRDRRRFGPIPVAVTFDDDLPSHAEEALPVLRRLGIPGTFFLGGPPAADPRPFWWEILQAAFDRGGDLSALALRLGVPIHGPADIRRVAALIQGLPAPERAELATLLEELAGDPVPAPRLAAEQIRELASGDSEVGFHTVTHAQLTALSDAELETALTDGRAELAEVAGAPVRTVAYPHGAGDARVAARAAAAGYEAGFLGRAQAYAAGDEPFLIGRAELHTPSLSYFALSVARWLQG